MKIIYLNENLRLESDIRELRVGVPTWTPVRPCDSPPGKRAWRVVISSATASATRRCFAFLSISFWQLVNPLWPFRCVGSRCLVRVKNKSQRSHWTSSTPVSTSLKIWRYIHQPSFRWKGTDSCGSSGSGLCFFRGLTIFTKLQGLQYIAISTIDYRVPLGGPSIYKSYNALWFLQSIIVWHSADVPYWGIYQQDPECMSGVPSGG